MSYVLVDGWQGYVRGTLSDNRLVPRDLVGIVLVIERVIPTLDKSFSYVIIAKLDLFPCGTLHFTLHTSYPTTLTAQRSYYLWHYFRTPLPPGTAWHLRRIASHATRTLQVVFRMLGPPVRGISMSPVSTIGTTLESLSFTTSIDHDNLHSVYVRIHLYIMYVVSYVVPAPATVGSGYFKFACVLLLYSTTTSTYSYLDTRSCILNHIMYLSIRPILSSHCLIGHGRPCGEHSPTTLPVLPRDPTSC